jgi:hypothetical protein
MAAISTLIAGLGLALGAVGTLTQMRAQRQQAAAQRRQLEAQMRAEEERRRQMNLDAQRRKRQEIRQAQVARANALAVATGQGAGEGSVMAGAEGGIFGQRNTNLVGINQNQEIGNRIFDYNAEAGRAGIAMANAGSTAAMGSGLTSLGGALVRSSGTLGSIGRSLFG